MIKQNSFQQWKIYIVEVKKNREASEFQNLENAAAYCCDRLKWKSLKFWWEFVMNRRKKVEYLKLLCQQFLIKNTLKQWHIFFKTERMKVWKLEAKVSKVAQRIILHFFQNNCSGNHLLND